MADHVALKDLIKLKEVVDPNVAEHADEDPNELGAEKGVIDIFCKFARLVSGQQVQPVQSTDPRGEVVDPVTGDHAIGERPGPGELNLDEAAVGQLPQDVGRKLVSRHAELIGRIFLRLGGPFDHIQEKVPGLD